MAQPTIPQMMNRIQGSHSYILRVLAGSIEPRPLMGSEGLGVSRARSTLFRWGCIERDGLTTRGEELLAAWERKDAERKAAYDRLYGARN